MPELNSTSPLSNSKAVALTSPTRPLELSWEPGVPHTPHDTPTPSEGSAQAATLSPSAALLCLTLLLFLVGTPVRGRSDASIFTLM